MFESFGTVSQTHSLFDPLEQFLISSAPAGKTWRVLGFAPGPLALFV